MITLCADSYWPRGPEPLLTQRRRATCGVLCILVCVCKCVCVMGFKVLVAKLDEMFFYELLLWLTF